MFKEIGHAQLYTKYRPVYHSSVYTAIIQFMKSGSTPADNSSRYRLALDIGCGSGQSTLPLATSFESVVGVDSSEAQLIEARKASTGNWITMTIVNYTVCK